MVPLCQYLQQAIGRIRTVLVSVRVNTEVEKVKWLYPLYIKPHYIYVKKLIVMAQYFYIGDRLAGGFQSVR